MTIHSPTTQCQITHLGLPPGKFQLGTEDKAPWYYTTQPQRVHLSICGLMKGIRCISRKSKISQRHFNKSATGEFGSDKNDENTASLGLASDSIQKVTLNQNGKKRSNQGATEEAT